MLCMLQLSQVCTARICQKPATSAFRTPTCTLPNLLSDRFLEDELARRYREAAPATLALLQVGLPSCASIRQCPTGTPRSQRMVWRQPCCHPKRVCTPSSTSAWTSSPTCMRVPAMLPAMLPAGALRVLGQGAARSGCQDAGMRGRRSPAQSRWVTGGQCGTLPHRCCTCLVL